MQQHQEISQQLNNQQNIAVNSTDGPVLVLAGAGTGKTKVLTSRISHIINSKLAFASQILAVTFTNKAANEMKYRISLMVGDEVNNLWMGTFHSIAAKILRRHPEIIGLNNDFTIIDDDDQIRLIKQILLDLNIDGKQFPPKNYLNKISYLKDKMINYQNISQQIEISLPEFSRVYSLYQERLKQMNNVDFGDLLLYNIEIFNKSPAILDYYQEKFRYILVDEYQDTNAVQYQWLLKLSAKYQNICCVGDDDQSIYSWRGADVKNILSFEKDFKNAKLILLEQNYRSTKTILKAAYSIIGNNKNRHNKTLWTNIDSGNKIKLYNFSDDREEAFEIANLIRSFAARSNYQLSQIAILVRAGYQTRRFEESFIQNSLSYRIIGGLKFYERAEIKDAIAYLRIVFNNNDDLALNRIINLPKRGIGESTISGLYLIAREQKTSLFNAINIANLGNNIKGKARDSLNILANNIKNWQKLINQTNFPDLAKIILEESGYIAMWRAENSVESRSRIENLEEFIASLADFSNISEFLEYVNLIENQKETSQNAVNIMTVHSAKGLEFDLVFIPGLEDGVFPNSKTINDNENEKTGLEEERRLIYVAITRAKKDLILSFADYRFSFGESQETTPSRFIAELPQDEIEFIKNNNIKNYFPNKSFTYKSSNNAIFNKQSYQVKSGSQGNNYQEKLYKNNAINNNQNFALNNNFKLQQALQNKSFEQNNATKTISNNRDLFSDAISSTQQKTQFLVKDKIIHQKFGEGIVLAIDDNKLTIKFSDNNIKIMIADFVKKC